MGCCFCTCRSQAASAAQPIRHDQDTSATPSTAAEASVPATTGGGAVDMPAWKAVDIAHMLARRELVGPSITVLGPTAQSEACMLAVPTLQTGTDTPPLHRQRTQGVSLTHATKQLAQLRCAIRLRSEVEALAETVSCGAL